MNLSKIADQLYTLRQERLVAQKEVDKLEVQEKALRTELFAALKLSPSGAVSGAIGHAEIKTSIVPTMVDPERYLRWCRKSPKRADAYKITVVTDVWRTLVSNGDNPDGVEAFTKEDLSLTKVK
jgi:hypothetical protein